MGLLIGSGLMVRPVMDQGASYVQLYLPGINSVRIPGLFSFKLTLSSLLSPPSSGMTMMITQYILVVKDSTLRLHYTRFGQ